MDECTAHTEHNGVTMGSALCIYNSFLIRKPTFFSVSAVIVRRRSWQVNEMEKQLADR